MQVAEDLPLLVAQNFVDRFTEYFQHVIMAQTDEINIVWEHNIMFMAVSFVETYRQFRDSGKPTQVMLAYHYTDSANLNSIECNGLMSKPERIQAGIESKKFSGEAWGPGIYCCHDPLSTARYGDTGILMAILRGNTSTVPLHRGTAENAQVEHEYDAVVASTPLSNRNSWSVLKTSRQVLPLVLLPKNFKLSQLKEFHTGLQKIVDEFFNHDVPAPVHAAWFGYDLPSTPRQSFN